MEEMKHCSRGDHEAPISEFGPSYRTPDGLVGSCRKCLAKYNKGQRRKHSRGVLLSPRDKFQIAAFQAMYKGAIIGGKDRLDAFVSAICGSCDAVFDKLPDGSVETWLEFREGKKK